METDYVKAESLKGKIATTMPASSPDENPTPLLSTIDKIKRMSEIEQTFKNLKDFRIHITNLKANTVLNLDK